MHVTIIGGGIIGLSSAYYLKKAGHEVTVIDKYDITDGCSFGNMGYISPSHFIPIATPGIIKQGLRWMTSSSSPFYIKPRLSLELLRWGVAFWRHSTAQNVTKNVPHLNNLLQLSRHLMNELKNELPGSFDMIEKGCWMLYRSAKTGDHEKYLAEQARVFGLKTVFCTPEQVQQYETEVEVNVAGGILYLDDCHVNASKLMQQLYSYLQNARVRFWLNTEVRDFEVRNNRVTSVITDKESIACEEVLIANGSWVGNISKRLGISIPVQPGKGYSIVYDGLLKNLQYPSILVDDRTATTPINKWLRIGGTMELSGHSNTILTNRVMAIYNAFGKYYPSMALLKPNVQSAWYGFRPVTPDGLPYIGRQSKFANVTYAGGHAMLGVSAAAGTGQLISEIISRDKSSIDISAFKPDRFR
jgi:D-amino-acid dehydrogenase